MGDILHIVKELESRKAENHKFQQIIRRNREAISDLNAALLDRLIELDGTGVVCDGKIYSRTFVVPEKQLNRNELADSMEVVLRDRIHDSDLVETLATELSGLRIAKVSRNRVERLVVKRVRKGKKTPSEKEPSES